MTIRPTILLVEDDDVEVMAITRSLQKYSVNSHVVVANNGVTALERLRATGAERIVPPCIILLDINMPQMNGHDFLIELRKDPALRKNVVFMLTTSNSPSDIERAYEHHVAGYIVKTDLEPGSAQLVDLIRDFASTVRLPGDGV